jgi:4-amino-4-deoxy-L-arabinose transferase-like glycosyltransferase
LGAVFYAGLRIKVNNTKLKKTLLVIFILALFLRIFSVVTQEKSRRLPSSDAKEFDNISSNIASGYGFSRDIGDSKVATTRRTPLYPLFVGGLYFIFGHNYIAVKLMQALLGALFCMVVFFITDLIYSDTQISIIAALVTAVYKPFISGFYYYGGPAYILSEYFYMFILGVTILIFLEFIKKETRIFGILSGIFIGLTILTRPEFITYPVLLLLYLFCISKQSVKQILKKYLMVYLFIFLTVAPWTIRNYIVSGKFIPLSTLNGQMFLFGNNSLANGGWAYPENYAELAPRVENLSEYERNKIFFRQGIEEVKKNCKRIPKLFVKKILVHYAPFEERFKIFNPYYAAILLLGSIGIVFFRRHNTMEYMILLLFFSTTLTAVIVLGDPRYRYPYEFGLIIFAAPVINEFFTIIQRKVLTYGKQ